MPNEIPGRPNGLIMFTFGNGLYSWQNGEWVDLEPEPMPEIPSLLTETPTPWRDAVGQSRLTGQYVDDFGGGSFVLDGGRLNGRPLSTSRDDTTDNGESAYDPDMPGKTLDEYMASWDALIREVRDSD